MITVQEIITQVKQIQGGLVGISRTNRPLHQQLTQKCQKLEKQLVACCDVIRSATTEDGLETTKASANEVRLYKQIDEGTKHIKFLSEDLESCKGMNERLSNKIKELEGGCPIRIINAKGEGEFVSQAEYDRRVAAGEEVNGELNEQSIPSKIPEKKEESTSTQVKGGYENGLKGAGSNPAGLSGLRGKK